MKRRSFIKSISLFASTLFPLSVFAKKIGEFNTVEEAFASFGFAPNVSGNAFFAAIGDPHITENHPERTELLYQIVNEIKAMKTPPAFCVLLGDLITNGNACFASVSKNHKMAYSEIEDLKKFLEDFKPIKTELVFGNHDTISPDDFENIIYKRDMPEVETYKAFDFGKIRCLILNGYHSADLGEKQTEWLQKEIKKAKGKKLIIFIHQPIGSTSTEFMASAQLREALADRKEDTKIICGHIHINRFETLELSDGRLIPQFALEAPRKNKAPVYWLFCSRNDNVDRAIFRDKNGKFVVYDFDSRRKAWLLPFENMGVKKAFTLNSKEYSEIKVKGWFNSAKCGSFYFYLKELEFNLDLSAVKEYSQLILLAARWNGKKAEPKFYAWVDGQEKIKLTPTSKTSSYIFFDLPESLRNQKSLNIGFLTGNIESNFGGVAVK